MLEQQELVKHRGPASFSSSSSVQQAQALWDDPDLIEIPARTTEEIDLYEG